MRPDPASTLPSNLGAPETEAMAPTDGLDAARGFVLGIILGLVAWLGVVGLAWAVWLIA